MIDRRENSAERGRSLVREIGAALLLLALVAPGCTKSPEKAETTRKQAVDVTFVEASEGLPTIGQWRERVAVADLDGDGKQEIIAPASRADSKARPMIWSRDGERWTEWKNEFPEWSYGYGDVVVADFDRDGKPDLAFASHAIGVSVLLNRGDGRWDLRNEGLPEPGSFWSRTLAAGDFDGDGWIDLAVLGELATAAPVTPLGLRIYRNEEGNSWSERRIPALDGAHGAALSAADLDGDDRPELIVGSLDSRVVDIVWKRESSGWKPLGSGWSSPRVYWNVATCRSGESSVPEIFLAEDAFGPDGPIGPRVYRLEDETWTSSSEGLPEKMRAAAIAAADFDRDGSCELATADIDDNVLTIFRRSSEGTWSEWKTFPRPEGIGGQIVSLTAADVDGDGHADLIANYASGEGFGGIRVWLTRP
jgi:hypothetical protein